MFYTVVKRQRSKKMGKFSDYEYRKQPRFDMNTFKGANQSIPMKTVVIHCFDPRAVEIPQAVAEYFGDEVCPAVLSNAIAHEVTQPLTAMMANAAAGLRWLDGATPDLDEAKTAFNQIVAAGQRVAAVIERVQAILRKGDLNTTAFNTNELVRETIKFVEDSLHCAREE
jgi:signal transduction histidine kinase